MTHRAKTLLLVAAAGLWPLSAGAADYVVLEARGIGWRPGTVIHSDKPLHLVQGQHVTLISESGATLRIDGPYDKSPATEGTQSVDIGRTLAALTTERNARLGDVGTTRAAPTVQLPGPWLLNAAAGGSACLRDNQPVTFWRADASKTAHFSIMPSDRSWRARSEWPAGMDRLTLRSDLAVHAGASYFVSLNGSTSAIYVNAVPASLANARMQAAWMADKGCEAQAEALLRTGGDGAKALN